MRTLTDGTVHVYTFKDDSRLLSPLAHDLCLRCTRFSATLDGERVRARFTADSLVVDGAVKAGRVDRTALGKLERGKIEGSVQKDVLATHKHPEIIFAGELRPAASPRDGERLEGGLTLLGRTVAVIIPVERRDRRVRGRVELVPSRWGIKPFTALLGALKVADRVVVEFDLAVPEVSDPPRASAAPQPSAPPRPTAPPRSTEPDA